MGQLATGLTRDRTFDQALVYPQIRKKMSITISDSIDSELIQTIKYDDEKQTLAIYFRKGRTLTYLCVPSEIWVDFLETENPDDFYANFIKDDYDTQED